MENWQPIATAPTDGTEVLVWRPEENAQYLAHVAVDYFEAGYGRWYRSRTYAQPTHWMPLPVGPTDCAGRGQTAKVDLANSYSDAVSAATELQTVRRKYAELSDLAQNQGVVDGNLIETLRAALKRAEEALFWSARQHHERGNIRAQKSTELSAHEARSVLSPSSSPTE